MVGRVRLSTRIVSERRDTVYDGSRRAENPLSERTSIDVPLLMVDVRVTPRFGLHASTAIPFVVRTGTVQQAGGSLRFRDEVRGLGDTVVGAWYRAGAPSTWTWTINRGTLTSDRQDASAAIPRESGGWQSRAALTASTGQRHL